MIKHWQGAFFCVLLSTFSDNTSVLLLRKIVNIGLLLVMEYFYNVCYFCLCKGSDYYCRLVFTT